MRRIKILGRALSEGEVAAVCKLAAQAGFSPEEIELTASVGDPVPDCDDEIVLVLMSPGTCANAGLEEELAKTPNGGRRAICIWPAEGNVPAEPPRAVRKYGYSIIPWNADK